MHNELITIGNVTLYGYGLMIGIGILAAYLFAEHQAKKSGLDSEPVFSILITGVLFGFLGAKLLYLITIFDQIIADPSIIFKDVSDGFVVYGGIIAGILSVAIYCRIKKLPFLRYLDAAAPAIALAQGFGRIGCFLAGCCYGMPTDSAFSITFTHSNYAPNNIPLFPSQLESSAFNFLHFFLLCALSKKKKAPGQIGAFYLIFYSIGRFIIEFFRGDLERGSVGALSTSQFISIFVVFAGILMLVLMGRHAKTTEDTQ